MTGSGGFPPGTPVSTHKKDLIQKENKEKENFTLFQTSFNIAIAK
jgi:hypothetical protein